MLYFNSKYKMRFALAVFLLIAATGLTATALSIGYLEKQISITPSSIFLGDTKKLRPHIDFVADTSIQIQTSNIPVNIQIYYQILKDGAEKSRNLIMEKELRQDSTYELSLSINQRCKEENDCILICDLSGKTVSSTVKTKLLQSAIDLTKDHQKKEITQSQNCELNEYFTFAGIFIAKDMTKILNIDKMLDSAKASDSSVLFQAIFKPTNN